MRRTAKRTRAGRQPQPRDEHRLIRSARGRPVDAAARRVGEHEEVLAVGRRLAAVADPRRRQVERRVAHRPPGDEHVVELGVVVGGKADLVVDPIGVAAAQAEQQREARQRALARRRRVAVVDDRVGGKRARAGAHLAHPPARAAGRPTAEAVAATGQADADVPARRSAAPRRPPRAPPPAPRRARRSRRARATRRRRARRSPPRPAPPARAVGRRRRTSRSARRRAAAGGRGSRSRPASAACATAARAAGRADRAGARHPGAAATAAARRAPAARRATSPRRCAESAPSRPPRPATRPPTPPRCVPDPPTTRCSTRRRSDSASPARRARARPAIAEQLATRARASSAATARRRSGSRRASPARTCRPPPRPARAPSPRGPRAPAARRRPARRRRRPRRRRGPSQRPRRRARSAGMANSPIAAPPASATRGRRQIATLANVSPTHVHRYSASAPSPSARRIVVAVEQRPDREHARARHEPAGEVRRRDALVAPAARPRPVALARHPRVEEDVPRGQRARRQRHAHDRAAGRGPAASPATTQAGRAIIAHAPAAATGTPPTRGAEPIGVRVVPERPPRRDARQLGGEAERARAAHQPEPARPPARGARLRRRRRQHERDDPARRADPPPLGHVRIRHLRGRQRAEQAAKRPLRQRHRPSAATTSLRRRGTTARPACAP